MPLPARPFICYRMKRQSTLLRVAFQTCQFLLKERDLPALLQGFCDHLGKDGLYRAVLIVLCDQASGGMITAETGLGDRTAQIMAPLRQGRLPACGTRVLSADDDAAQVCESCDCGFCAPGNGKPADRTLCASLRCNPSLAGFLLLRLPRGIRLLPAERQKVTELAEALTEALRQLFATEVARQREHELVLAEERYELALQATRAGLWDWNIRTGEMYTSPNQVEHLDYRAGEGGLGALGRVIHPEDKDRVLQVLNEHLQGRTDEYRIEYRVRDKDGEWVWYLDRGRVVERDEHSMPVRMTGTHQDITLQKKQEQAISAVQRQLHDSVDRERSFLQTVIDSAGDPVLVIDLNFNLLLINRAAAWLFRGAVDTAAMEGRKCYQLFCNAYRPCRDSRFPCPVEEVRASQGPVKLIHNPYHGNGVNNTFELEVSPLRDAHGELYGVIEVARDITDRLRIEEELRANQSHLYRLAHHDSLTGLPNRLLFRDRLNQAAMKAMRKRTNVAVLFLDLDRFKQINDALGHDVGDALLIEVAARLANQCRQYDTVARLGGDEFVFVLEDIVRAEDATAIAGKILESFTAPIVAAGQDLQISTSIGLALFPQDAADIDGVIKCADLALYAAKGRGRNTVQLYHRDIGQGEKRPRLHVEDYREALEQGQFRLAYQPQHEAGSGRLVGLETLLRWQHPRLGLLLPEAFIAEATEWGMLGAIGDWIIDQVCDAVDDWREHHVPVPPLTVHIASRQLLEADFLPRMQRMVAAHDIDPALLVFALRERAIVGAAGPLWENILEIGRLGFAVAVNDVGSGCGCLPRLAELPLHRLTLARSLVAALPHDAHAARLTMGLIGLGRSLGAIILAPEVEREEQRCFLRDHGCELIQGPLLSPILPLEECTVLLAAPQKGD